MSHLTNFLNEFSQRSGMRGKLTKRLFAGMLAGLQAAQQDMSALRQEMQEQQKELSAADVRQEEQTARLMQELQSLQRTAEQEKLALQQRLDHAEQVNADLQEQLRQMQEMLAPEGALRQNLETLNVNMRSNNAQLETLQSDNALCKLKLSGLERRQNTAAPAQQSGSAPAVRVQDSDYDTIDYFDFENHFRGSIARIKEAQRMYLPYFQGKKNVLDIGCGRGEFLSLLHDEGIPARGVDVYEPYAEYCRMQGLSAECGDGIACLQTLDSVDGIFVGQVVEHLKTEQITALCNTAYEKLTDGGCIVIETPNPTSLAIYTGAFYIDPSHVKPVHPLTMQYFLEKAGFTNIEILYPEQSKPDVQIRTTDPDMQKITDIMFGAQDYAIIAVK